MEARTFFQPKNHAGVSWAETLIKNNRMHLSRRIEPGFDVGIALVKRGCGADFAHNIGVTDEAKVVRAWENICAIG